MSFLPAPDGLLKALSEHLGCDKHEPVGRNRGNSGNGKQSKAVLTDAVGDVDIDVPRDRDGSFEPMIVKKRHPLCTSGNAANHPPAGSTAVPRQTSRPSQVRPCWTPDRHSRLRHSCLSGAGWLPAGRAHGEGCVDGTAWMVVEEWLLAELLEAG
jgi:hypothetical protein